MWRRVESVAAVLEQVDPPLHQTLLNNAEGGHEWVWLLPVVMLTPGPSIELTVAVWERVWARSAIEPRFDAMLIAGLLIMHREQLIDRAMQPGDMTDLVSVFTRWMLAKRSVTVHGCVYCRWSI